MHSHSDALDNERRLLPVVAITALYMLTEVVGGAVTGSLALLADSGYLLGDVLGLAMALGAIRFARRTATAGNVRSGCASIHVLLMGRGPGCLGLRPNTADLLV